MNALPAWLQNSKRQRIAEGVSAGLGSANIPFVSLMGGAFTLTDSDGEEIPIQTRFFDCVICDVNLEVAIQRTFWGEVLPDGTVRPKPQFDPTSKVYENPLCFSDNGIGASRNARGPQSTSCTSCQWNQWNFPSKTDPSKRSTACRPTKKIAVIPVGWANAKDEDVPAPMTVEAATGLTPVPMYDFAFRLNVPIMSHENLRAYSSKFKGQDFDVSNVITRITFVPQVVGQLDFTAVTMSTEEIEGCIVKLMDEKATDILIGRGDIPFTGTLPAPQNQAQITEKLTQAAQQAVQQTAPVVQALPPAATPPAARKGRPRKTPQEPQGAPASPAAPDDGAIPPFLRRQPAGSPLPDNQFQGDKGSGVVTKPATPNAEMEAALASVFKL